MVVFLLWSQSIFRRQREGFALYLRLLLNSNIIDPLIWSFSLSWILSSFLRLLVCSKANDTLFSIYICKPVIDSFQSCSRMKTRHLRALHRLTSARFYLSSLRPVEPWSSLLKPKQDLFVYKWRYFFNWLLELSIKFLQKPSLDGHYSMY